MDLGIVGLDGLVGSDSSSSCFASSLVSDPETKQKWYCESGFLKQERSGSEAEEDNYWRSSKVAKSEDVSASKAMLPQQRELLFRSNTTLLSSDGQQMLSFSSPNSQTLTLPYYHPTSSTYDRNTGYGGLNGSSMHGVLTGVRGPFTPLQWMELEHQALINKYITENVPIPSNLLIPIRRALDSASFSSYYSGGPLTLRPNAMGWGAFHLGYSNTTDSEPGRCRRTDGKKWRCSKDAVADQKYCERHINRGRHRSRKPVEGQNGHSVPGSTTTTATTKLMPMGSSTSALVVPRGGASYSLSLSHHPQQSNTLQPGAPNFCASSSHVNRMSLNKENMGERIQKATDLSMLSPTVGLKENQFSIPKQHNPYGESSRAVFGSVCSDSLLNPLHKSSSLISSQNYVSSQDLNDRKNESSQHPVHQFMDDWPKNLADRTHISWPNIDLQADRTQLSITIPVAASDFMSSTSSPANKKLALSPLRLSREFESTEMGLGVGSVMNEPNPRQTNWIPISWGTSMGGPLGEVLHSTNNSAGECKNSSALNLLTEGWDSSPQLRSSPTGVLQKMTFGSVSNSSTGSSPRAENQRANEGGASFCSDFLGSTLVNSSSLPAL